MNAQELYEEWTDGEENGMRPKRVQALRDEFAEATGLAVPHSTGQIEGWLETMRGSGVITRKLREAAEVSDEPDGSEAAKEPPPDDGE